MKPPVLLSWSSGKDCAWALHILQQQAQFDVVALVTTFNEASDRVAMHGVSMELVEAQARSAGLALWSIPLPWPCTNEIYEQCIRAVVARALREGIRTFAYGDLHLREIRTYREKQLAGTTIEPIFPIWDRPDGTALLAHTMIKAGLRAVVASVDPNQLDNSFVGREFDQEFLADLPTACDPCGERGEFHTFCYDGPMFNEAVSLCVEEPVLREGHWFADLALRP